VPKVFSGFKNQPQIISKTHNFCSSQPAPKHELAAIRMLYDFLVIRQLVPVNPTTSVRGPKYVVKRGKTPVWSREDAKKLLESIPRNDLAGLRDRALISTMLFSFLVVVIPALMPVVLLKELGLDGSSLGLVFASMGVGSVG
jgi:site-specific recombinase XerC